MPKGINIHRRNPPAGGSEGTNQHKRNSQDVKRGMPKERRTTSRASKPASRAMDGGGGVPVRKGRGRGRSGEAGQKLGKIV